MKKIKEEAIRLYDNPGDTRSFNDIYKDKMGLFEDDTNDIISPKMKALFEQVYGNNQTRLREEIGGDASKNPNHNFSGGEGKPSGDGVCDGHNSSLMGGEDPCTTQGQGRGDSNNAKLFNEAQMKDLFEKAKLKEDFEDDYEFDPEWDGLDDEEFDFDAAEDENEIDPLDVNSLHDLDNDDFSLGDVDGDDGYGSWEDDLNLPSEDEFDLE
jgi:hypothetical protein